MICLDGKSVSYVQSSERCCVSDVSSLMVTDIVWTAWDLRETCAAPQFKWDKAEEYWPKCTGTLLLDFVSKRDKRISWSTVWKVAVRSKSTNTAECTESNKESKKQVIANFYKGINISHTLRKKVKLQDGLKVGMHSRVEVMLFDEWHVWRQLEHNHARRITIISVL